MVELVDTRDLKSRGQKCPYGFDSRPKHYALLCVQHNLMNDFIASLMLLGAISSSNGYLPYWMTTNQYGLMPERNGALALFQASTQFDESKTFQYRFGTSLAANAYNNPLDVSSRTVNLMVDELYGSLKWRHLTLDIGIKHRENDFIGASKLLGSLSVTGGHLVETGNARSLPGYLISLDPVAVPWTKKHLWLYGAYGDFATTDDRYVKNALVHRTRVGLRIFLTQRLSLDAVLDHYAMWAGQHPENVSYPVSLKNYIRVVTGSSAGNDGTMSDRLNVIGDQGGSEIIRVSYRADNWVFTAQHDIPYADGSGMGFQNFPDGVNTLSFSFFDKNRWISDVVYEHQYTMYQSGPINGEAFDKDGNSITPSGVSTVGIDNYFNNSYYKSGWTHHGRMIGDPLLVPKGTHKGEWSSALVTLGIENNRVKSHHLGIGGKLFRKHPYKLMLTYSDNYGTYHTPYVGESQCQKPWGTVKETGLKQFSAAFVGQIDFLFKVQGISVLYGLYVDKGQLYRDSVGATLGVRYSLTNISRKL